MDAIHGLSWVRRTEAVAGKYVNARRQAAKGNVCSNLLTSLLKALSQQTHGLWGDIRWWYSVRHLYG